MRVMCINDKWKGKPVEHGLKHPQVGDIDDVVDVIEGMGSSHYILRGYGDNRGFRCDHFATLPDEPAELIVESISEPELVTA